MAINVGIAEQVATGKVVLLWATTSTGTVTWSQSSGPATVTLSGTGAQRWFTPATAGTYTFSGTNGTDTATKQVIVAAPSGGTATTDASQLTTGTLADARLPATVQRKGAVLTPEAEGAVGDGVADDLLAVRAAITKAVDGDTILLTRTYRHTDVINFSKPGVTITGGGTLLATVPATSAVWITADRVTMRGITLRAVNLGARQSAYEQMKLRIGSGTQVAPVPANDVTVSDVVILGSAASGIFVGGGSKRFRIVNCSSSDSLADGLHMTEGVSDGLVLRWAATRPGDDGCAVVSYTADAAVCKNITVAGVRVKGQYHGRGVSVVGGDSITYVDVYAETTYGAAIYIVGENGTYSTRPCTNVQVLGAQLFDANRFAADQVGAGAAPYDAPTHGAILIDNQSAGSQSNITLRDIVITNSWGGYRVVGCYNTTNCVIDGLTIRGKRGRVLVDGTATVTNLDSGQPTDLVLHKDETWLTTPEGNVAAAPGSSARLQNGTVWRKDTGTGSTGWVVASGGGGGGTTTVTSVTAAELATLMGA